jgi:hypothetical protein
LKGGEEVNIFLNFSMNSYSIEKIEDSDLSILKLEVCHDKHNKNGSFFSLKNMVKAQHTIYGKPILYAMNEAGEDFKEHEATGELRAAGYVSEHSGNIRYEEKDGRMYLIVYAVIWNVYVPEVIQVFERDGTKGISMEIKVKDYTERSDGYIDIKDYRYLSIVLLGDEYNTGMYNTTAKFEFSQIEEKIQETEELLSYKNKEKEGENMFDRQAHAEKFKLTSNDLRKMMKESAYAEGDYYVDDYCANFVYVYSFEDGNYYGVPYAIAEGKCSLDFGCKKKMKLEYVEVEEGEDYVAFTEEMFESKLAPLESTISELKEANEKFAEKVKAYEEKDNEAIKEKEEAIFSLDEKVKSLEKELEDVKTENEELSTFKANRESEIRAEKVSALFTKLGSKLNKEEIESWKEKEKEAETFEGFEREISTFALNKILENVESEKTTFSRIDVGTQKEDEDEAPKNIWDKLKNKNKGGR